MNAALVGLTLLVAAPSEPPAPDTTETVRTGLAWLAKQQKPDGSWTLSDDTAPTRVTAMAGLALLMQGSTLKEGPYAPHLRKALDWFEKKAADEESLGRDRMSGITVTRDHAHAILFLVGASGEDDNADRLARVKKLVDRAIGEALRHQTARGGWGVYLDPQNVSDTSECTADMLHALFAARRAGFEVPQKAPFTGLAYLVRATNANGGVVASLSGTAVRYGNDGRGGHRISAYHATAAALMSDGPRPEELVRWVKYTGSDGLQQAQAIGLSGAYGMLQQFQAARACFLLGERGHRRVAPNVPGADLVTWSAYRAVLFKALKETQGRDGTWSDKTLGPTYPTAMALVVLQLENGYLPAFAR